MCLAYSFIVQYTAFLVRRGNAFQRAISLLDTNYTSYRARIIQEKEKRNKASTIMEKMDQYTVKHGYYEFQGTSCFSSL